MAKVWILFKFGFRNKSKISDLWRHTKAMHLTEADVNPIFIRDFLGHTDLKVTEIYSKTSIKMKKAALDKMKSGKEVIPEKPLKDWTEDKSLLEWLNGLKH